MSRRPKVREMRKERKYNLIIPFWFEIEVEANFCIEARPFGIAFSSQARSIIVDAKF